MTKDEIQEKALAALLPHERCGAAVSMGVGKTKIGLDHMANNYTDQSRFLVVVPKNTIETTWKEEAVKYGLGYLLDHIVFSNYRSLIKQDLDFDVVYLDECHSLKESHDSWLSQYQGKIVGLTGTPPKHHNSEKGLMVDKYCPIVFRYITDSAISDKILNDYRIIVHTLKLNSSKTMLVQKGGKSWYTSELASYQYWTGRIDSAYTKKDQAIMRVMRMKDMMEFPSKEAMAKSLLLDITSNGQKCLLFCNTMAQADKLCPYSYHSDNPSSAENLEKFKDGSIKELSCVLQLSEGVNIPNLRACIIMHAYGNERKASQRIGRLLRLNPDDIATVHILCYEGTVDEQWVTSALEDFDKSKITWV